VPGSQEELTGVPLTGPAGRMLFTPLRRWVPESAVSRINLVNCRTTRPGLTRDRVNRDPTAREIAACARRIVVPYLRRSPARHVLLLGDLVYRTCVGLGNFGSEAVGHRQPVTLMDIITKLAKLEE